MPSAWVERVFFHLSKPMIAALSIVSVVIGTSVAWIAARHPRRRKAMETLGGTLLIAGFALLGYSLKCIFGPP